MEHRRIEWARQAGLGQSGWIGRVGGQRVFTINMSMTRGEGYVLRTTLPYRLSPEPSTGEADALKAYAERALERFVNSLGASF